MLQNSGDFSTADRPLSALTCRYSGDGRMLRMPPSRHSGKHREPAGSAGKLSFVQLQQPSARGAVDKAFSLEQTPFASRSDLRRSALPDG